MDQISFPEYWTQISTDGFNILLDNEDDIRAFFNTSCQIYDVFDEHDHGITDALISIGLVNSFKNINEISSIFIESSNLDANDDSKAFTTISFSFKRKTRESLKLWIIELLLELFTPFSKEDVNGVFQSSYYLFEVSKGQTDLSLKVM
jgi:hypothetical protein